MQAFDTNIPFKENFLHPPPPLAIESYIYLCETGKILTLKNFDFEKMPFLFALSTELRGIHPLLY